MIQVTAAPPQTFYIALCSNCGSHLVAYAVISIAHIYHDDGNIGFQYTVVGNDGVPRVIDQDDAKHHIVTGIQAEMFNQMYEIAVQVPCDDFSEPFLTDEVPDEARTMNRPPREDGDLDLDVWGGV